MLHTLYTILWWNIDAQLLGVKPVDVRMKNEDVSERL